MFKILAFIFCIQVFGNHVLVSKDMSVLNDLIKSYNLDYVKTIDLPLFKLNDNEILMCYGNVDNCVFEHSVYPRDKEVTCWDKKECAPIIFDINAEGKMLNISYYRLLTSATMDHTLLDISTYERNNNLLKFYSHLSSQTKFLNDFFETRKNHHLEHIGLTIDHIYCLDSKYNKYKSYSNLTYMKYTSDLNNRVFTEEMHSVENNEEKNKSMITSKDIVFVLIFVIFMRCFIFYSNDPYQNY